MIVREGTRAYVMSPARYGEWKVRRDLTFTPDQLILDNAKLDAALEANKPWLDRKAWPELDAVDEVLMETHARQGRKVFGVRNGSPYFLVVNEGDVHA